MTWLLRDGDVLAAAEVADGLAGRARGLLGRDGYDGAMVLPRTRSVHTIGMRFPIDVAFCDRDLVVLDVTTRVPPLRMTVPRRGCRPGDRGRGRGVRTVGPPGRRPAGAARMSGDGDGGEAPADPAAGPGAGALVLVGTPIGNLGDLSPRAVEALASADVIYCEDTRHSRKLLTHAGISGVPLRSLHEHNEADRVDEVVAAVAAGGPWPW